MNPKTGPHRPSSCAAWVPGHAHARLPERSGVVLKERRMTNERLSEDDPVPIQVVIRSASVRFIPPRGHLLPQSQAQSQIRFELDFILDVPGGLRGAVKQWDRIWVHNKLGWR